MDDIQYLKEHGKEESYMFIVDSARRDITHYPDPNSYTISFNAPFKNVTGLELLDATVPRTEYTVESANSFQYSIDGGPTKTVRVTPGDYNLLELSQKITDALPPGFVCEPESTPYTRTSRARFYCSEPFELYMSVPNSIRGVLGFPGTQATYTSALTGESSQLSFAGPFPGFQSTRVIHEIRQAFTPKISGVPSSIVVHAVAGSPPITATIVDSDGEVYGSAIIDPSVSDETAVEDGVRLETGPPTEPRTYYLVMESVNASVYINEPPDNVEMAQVSSNGTTWTTIPEELSACCEINVSVPRHEIVSTGMVDITGERYVLIRCPNVETLMHRERAYEQYHAGLGMVKLGGMGYREQRFDFVSLPSVKIPNPVGKVSSLSFRLEKSDGTLYDAKGVNHMLVLKISYYANLIKDPMTVEETTRLNPQYTPHINRYLDSKWSHEARLQDTRHGDMRGQRGGHR